MKKWIKILNVAIKRNGWRQLFFYLSNLDVYRFIELSKTMEFLDKYTTKNKVILELGSGYSLLPAIIQDDYEHYIGLDLSKGASKYQKRINITPIIADMQHLPFKDGTISTVFAISSIEHVPNDKMVFEEITRVSGKDAEIIITVPFTNNEIKIKKMERSKFLMNMLNKFNRIWKLILKDHFNYFIDQTSTDSFMKYYNLNEINMLAKNNGLFIKDYYVFEKILSHKIFGIIPCGWFVIKDMILGYILWRIEDIFLPTDTNGGGIFIEYRK